jgi:hypothetical protein
LTSLDGDVVAFAVQTSRPLGTSVTRPFADSPRSRARRRPAPRRRRRHCRCCRSRTADADLEGLADVLHRDREPSSPSSPSRPRRARRAAAEHPPSGRSRSACSRGEDRRRATRDDFLRELVLADLAYHELWTPRRRRARARRAASFGRPRDRSIALRAAARWRTRPGWRR